MDTHNNIDKFYQPKIEEFHVGFRYESFEVPFQEGEVWTIPPAEWVKRTVLDINQENYNSDHITGEHKHRAIYHVCINNLYEKNVEWNKNIRVKSLNHYDIIEAGWEENKNQSSEFLADYILGDYLFDIFDSERGIRINYRHETVFFGKIKNYNKLLDIMEMLGIKKN